MLVAMSEECPAWSAPIVGTKPRVDFLSPFLSVLFVDFALAFSLAFMQYAWSSFGVFRSVILLIYVCLSLWDFRFWLRDFAFAKVCLAGLFVVNGTDR